MCLLFAVGECEFLSVISYYPFKVGVAFSYHKALKKPWTWSFGVSFTSWGSQQNFGSWTNYSLSSMLYHFCLVHTSWALYSCIQLEQAPIGAGDVVSPRTLGLKAWMYNIVIVCFTLYKWFLYFSVRTCKLLCFSQCIWAITWWPAFPKCFFYILERVICTIDSNLLSICH